MFAEIEKYVSWLEETPPYTTYRVNLLKCTREEIIEKIKSALGRNAVEPAVYGILPEAVVVESLSGEKATPSRHRGRVVVDAACGAAVLRGSHVYAPAVMALRPDVSLNDEVDIYADVAGKCKKGRKTDFEDELLLYVGAGLLKQNRDELFCSNAAPPKGLAVQTLITASGIPIIDNDIFPLGTCLLQNLPSIVCSKVLNPKCGEIVLDMCAAPGNKTTHLAEIMKNDGIIIALDRSVSKIQQIKSKCQNYNISCVHAFAFDSTKAAIDREYLQDCKPILEGPPYYAETFDKILLDAPCSALGQRPMLKRNFNEKMLNSYVPLQRKLFIAAVKLLKIHGTLVYSTCTILQSECELMVVWALKTFPNLKLISAEPLLGGPGRNNTGLTEDQRLKVQHFGWCTEDNKNIYNNTIGFFIAHFKKHETSVG